MRKLDRNLKGRILVSREEVLAAGGDDSAISTRTRNGWWVPVHAGVYRIGPLSHDWLEKLEAAVLAAGPEALVSHRAAYVLWGLEGIDARLVELTVPYAQAPTPDGVIRHRTRRPLEAARRHGLPVTTVERTLLDVSPMVPIEVLSRGTDSAVRLGLTTPPALAKTISELGGPGVRGVRKLVSVVDTLFESGATDSPAEVELLEGMKAVGLPRPTLQWEIVAPSGKRYRVDFGWPDLLKGVEVDGLLAHSGAENLERDLARQNDLLDAGIELRRFTGRAIRHDLDNVVAQIARFLAS